MKAAYDLPELAAMAGVSIAKVERMLNRQTPPVPIRGGGRKGSTRYVYLSDLRRIDADLWDSIRLASDSDSE